MTDHFKNIYYNHAARYQRMVQVEDADGNLLTTLRDIHPFEGATIVEMGAGTGRVTRLLAPFAGRILAHDISFAMLGEAARLRTAEMPITLTLADYFHMPLPAACADVCIEGWAFGHIRFWHAADWQNQTDRALAELDRLLKPGGTAILIETLGTGHKHPYPAPQLIEFYAYLEGEHGFRSTWCRTDYRFPSTQEAAEHIAFFFGDSVPAPTTPEVPECTGIWWRRKPQ